MKQVQIEDLLGRNPIKPDMTEVFEKYRLEIVYHAAAHKHVPLMEDSPCEEIRNNALRTYKTAFAAKVKEGKAYEVPQLFTHEMKDMITAPKVVEALKTAQTEFVAVRFGNVLGSDGSVIPIFKRQIEAGGSVTVTHPDIICYFMTIPEAVSLVLLAGTHAKEGEIFVLDMGEPVKIDTLARNLIRLSGYTPDVDIKLTYTGLRLGEKLYEEKLMAEEGLKKTKNDLIHIGCPIPFDIEEFLEQLDSLLEAAYKNKDDMKERVQKVVSTYHPA